ncbi:MAG: DUF6795 domain-containing protein [Gemmataceae bacterium]
MKRVVVAIAFLLFQSGCRKAPPEFTPVEGVVLLDGKPLPQALVEFAPQLSEWGAEMNSRAITDENGRFRLEGVDKGREGAAVASHKVAVQEAPPRAEFRGMDARSQEGLERSRAKLKNRPIPDVYGNLVRTPLLVDVKVEQREYTLTLKR